jgi:hypothetical protein
MTAVRRVRLPSLEAIDRAVQELVATHGYVDTTGLPAHTPGEFPTTVRQVTYRCGFCGRGHRATWRTPSEARS